MNTIFKIKSIGEVTAKGNQTIQVSVTKGFITQPTPYFVLSNPEAIKASGIKVGDDVSDVLSSCIVEQSSVSDPETGEVVTFNWLVPAV